MRIYQNRFLKGKVVIWKNEEDNKENRMGSWDDGCDMYRYYVHL